MARKTHTSSEVSERWKKKAYNRYYVSFRKDTDKDIIDYIEQKKKTTNTTEVFREVFNEFLKNN